MQLTRDEGGRAAIVVTVIAAIVVAVMVVAALLVQRKHHDDKNEAFAPIVAASSSFPVPAGAQQAFDDDKRQKPLQIVRGWSMPGELDAVCTVWRESFRTWMGGLSAPTGAVSGDYSPDTSCSYEGDKDEFHAKLLVARYANGTPQVTLTLTVR